MQLTWIKKVYLYLVSLISLVIMVIAGIILINLAIKTWVFPKADNDIYYGYCPAVGTTVKDDSASSPSGCADDKYSKDQRNAQKQRDASQALAMIIVAAPVFFYHWRLARKEA